MKPLLVATVLLAAMTVVSVPAARSADWPMFGRDATRNPASPEENPPIDWQVELPNSDGRVLEPARNVRWSAALGGYTIAPPVIAGGLVWICTTNGVPRDPASTKDAGALMCFRERDGAFLWQRLTPRIGNRTNDWPFASTPSPPLVEGDRLWYVTNRWEVVCLDVAPLLAGTGQPREVWTLDMPRELGVFGKCPGMAIKMRCAIGASHEGRIYIITGNGVDDSYVNVPVPTRPASFAWTRRAASSSGRTTQRARTSSTPSAAARWSRRWTAGRRSSRRRGTGGCGRSTR